MPAKKTRRATRLRASKAQKQEGVALKTCGDNGGTGEDGTPCTREAGWGTSDATGKCRDHNDAAVAKREAIKAAFLEHYANQPVTARKAAKLAGSDQVSIWKMRNADPSFDAKVNALKPYIFNARLESVEDAHFVRCASDKVSAAEVKFYLTNHSRHRTDGGIKYIDTYRSEHTGAGGAPIQMHQTGTQVITFGNNEIEM